MRSGKCRNCGEESVYRRPPTMGGFADVAVAQRIALDKTSYAVTVHYVCSRCGYTETYLEDEPALAKVAAGWDKIS